MSTVLGRIVGPFRSLPVEPYPVDQELLAATNRLADEASKLREALTDAFVEEPPARLRAVK